jgi:hypothetical protein
MKCLHRKKVWSNPCIHDCLLNITLEHFQLAFTNFFHYFKVPFGKEEIPLIRIRQNPCKPGNALSFSVAAGGNFFLMHYENFHWWTQVSISKICGDHCQSFSVYDLVFIDQSTIIGYSNSGLFEVSLPIGKSRTILTGMQSIDSGSEPLKFSSTTCYSQIITLYGSSNVYWASTLSYNVKHSWKSKNAINLRWVDFFDASLSLTPVALVYNFQHFVYQVYNILEEISIFSFPSNVTIHGIMKHENEFSLYAFGSAIFKSIDNGKTWSLLKNELRPVDLFLESHVVKFSSAVYGDRFAMLTEGGTIIYGKDTSDVTIPLLFTQRFSPSLANDIDTLSVRKFLYFDDSGVIHKIVPYSPDGENVQFYCSTIDTQGSTLLSDIEGENFESTQRNLVGWQSTDANLWVNLLGLSRVRLIAVNRNSSTVQANVFHESDIGSVVKIAGGGTMLVESVDSLGAQASAVLVKPLLFSPLFNVLPPSSSNVTLTLTNSESPIPGASIVSIVSTISGFSLSHEGVNLILENKICVFILKVTSETSAKGLVQSSAEFTAVNSFSIALSRILDLRSTFGIPIAPHAQFQLSPSTPNLGAIANLSTISTASFSFSRSLVNYFVNIEAPDGARSLFRIVKFNSVSSVMVVIVTYPTDLSSIVGINIFQGHFLNGRFLQPIGAWYILPGPCLIKDFSMSDRTRRVHAVEYLNSLDELNFELLVQWDLKYRVTGISRLSVMLSGAHFDMYQIKSKISSHRNFQHFDNTVNLKLDNIDGNVLKNFASDNFTGREILTALTVRSHPASLTCEVGSFSIKIINGCHPSYRLFFDIPNSRELLLQENILFTNGRPMVIDLPVS